MMPSDRAVRVAGYAVLLLGLTSCMDPNNPNAGMPNASLPNLPSVNVPGRYGGTVNSYLQNLYNTAQQAPGGYNQSPSQQRYGQPPYAQQPYAQQPYATAPSAPQSQSTPDALPPTQI